MPLMLPRTLSVVIPNWNGERLLEPCLESVERALSFAGYREPREIIVADDGSTDGSVALLRERFPGVRVVAAPKRSGFIASANSGAELVTGAYVLLLNNDVTLEETFFTRWERPFDDPAVFSVTARMLRPDGITYDSGRRVGVWDRGLIRHWVISAAGTVGPTLYGSGGASFYETARFRALGGFDPLYRPMYMEDLDLSYRGWKRGWKTIYQPDCLARHQASVSARRVYSHRRLHAIIAKNHYLFIWKNITDASLSREHLLGLPYWLAQGWRPRRRIVTLGLLLALPQLPEALAKRAEERREQRVSDAEIWARFFPTDYDLAHSRSLGWAGTL
jgi:GT2 family glycosyltransferase